MKEEDDMEDYVELEARKRSYQDASGSGGILPASSKDRSSGHQGMHGIKSGAQGTGTHGHHGGG